MAPSGGPEAPKIPLGLGVGQDRLFQQSKGQSTANSNQFSNLIGGGGSTSAKSQITKNLLQTSVIKDLRQ